MTKRGDRAAPPAIGAEFDIRFANAESAKGWDQLGRQAAGNLRRAFEVIREDPRSAKAPDRHHRLKGTLGTGLHKGEQVERWQYEVTGGGRIWYLIDDSNRTVWVTYAGSGHPKMTD